MENIDKSLIILIACKGSKIFGQLVLIHPTYRSYFTPFITIVGAHLVVSDFREILDFIFHHPSEGPNHHFPKKEAGGTFPLESCCHHSQNGWCFFWMMINPDIVHEKW